MKPPVRVSTRLGAPHPAASSTSRCSLELQLSPAHPKSNPAAVKATSLGGMPALLAESCTRQASIKPEWRQITADPGRESLLWCLVLNKVWDCWSLAGHRSTSPGSVTAPSKGREGRDGAGAWHHSGCALGSVPPSACPCRVTPVVSPDRMDTPTLGHSRALRGEWDMVNPSWLRDPRGRVRLFLLRHPSFSLSSSPPLLLPAWRGTNSPGLVQRIWPHLRPDQLQTGLLALPLPSPQS